MNIKNLKNLIKPYCEHLEKGFSEKSFVPCDYSKLEEFAKNENLMEKIEMAKRASQKAWEFIALNALKEDFEFFKSDVWIFVMKSRFGWSDAPKVEIDNEPQIIDVQLKLNNDEGLTDEEKKEYCG